MKTGTVVRYRSGFLLLAGLLTGLVLSGTVIGLLTDYRLAARHFWLCQLALGCWLLLSLETLLAVVVIVRRLLHRRWGLALVWLLLAGMGGVLCGAALLPVLALNGAGTSAGEPPPGSPERIEADRLP